LDNTESKQIENSIDEESSILEVELSTYDAYVSYENAYGEVILELVELFRMCLSKALNREAKIFFDAREIGVTVTKDHLSSEALTRAKILLAILTPAYFELNPTRS
jgi:hypothetical protein